MITSHEYDSNYAPAAPVMPVGISPSGEADSVQEVIAFMDTGADATMIPIDILKAVGGRYVERRRMRAVIGDSSVVNLYLIAVHLAGNTVYGIRAVALPRGKEVIIGRDVLNQFIITLNGLAHVAQVEA